MTRLTDQDYQRLVEFTSAYRVEEIFESKPRTQLIRRAHRHCLAAIQALANIEILSALGCIQFGANQLKVNHFCYHSLQECFSDISSSFYAALHGLNKPAHMALRSAIETSIRALAGIESEEAAQTTSVYKLFELAKGNPLFQSHATRHFDILKSEYNNLCGHTHTATISHMVKHHAMSSFPKLGTEKLKEWVGAYEKSVTAILSMLIINNKKIYLSAKPKAQDVFDEMLPREVRLFALGGL